MIERKIGSLFDGSGGFPLAAAMCGIKPAWASEVEPYPIAVTRSRFPQMRHLGSVTEVKGGEVEPVDIVTFGSPCQDLSVAGKRAGLKHEANGDEETTRSGLFMEAVRIIKEMREKTNGRYPTFAVWENVPGAFSSNQGEDFRTVLEELIKIVEPTAAMPAVPPAGWPYADLYCGDGWSLAYRTLDAQYWGVPQRRRRIYLVLDLGGQRAGEVCFKREGLRGYFAEGRPPWQGSAGDAEGGAGAADRPCLLKIRSGCEGGGKGPLVQMDKLATLATNNDQYLFQPVCSSGAVAGTLDANYYRGCGMRQGFEREYVVQPVTLEPGIAAREGGHIYEGVSGTLRANAGDNRMAVAMPILDDQGGAQISVRTDGKAPTLRAETHGNLPCVLADKPPCLSCNYEQPIVAGVDSRGALTPWDNQARRVYAAGGTFPALAAREKAGQNQQAVLTQYIVRRLTPTECARLQGFPDHWGHPDHKEELTDEEYAFWTEVRATFEAINGRELKTYRREQMLAWYNKLHTDSAEYKMWGNGIALPTALYVMQGIRDALDAADNQT